MHNELFVQKKREIHLVVTKINTTFAFDKIADIRRNIESYGNKTRHITKKINESVN